MKIMNNVRPLTRLEQLEWLKNALEQELLRVQEQLEKCDEELQKERKNVKVYKKGDNSES